MSVMSVSGVNDNWINKYVPKSVADICCNQLSVKNICRWIKRYKFNKTGYKNKYLKKNKKPKKSDKAPMSCLLITGNHGVGKTVYINTVLAEYNCNIQKINFKNVKNNNLPKIFSLITKSNNILEKMQHTKPKIKVVVIDELESITSTKHRRFIIELLKKNNNEWFCPIILISNNKHNKFLVDIKKISKEIKIYNPKAHNMIKILDTIIKKEKINIQCMDVKNSIIEHSQNDIRNMILTLRDIKYEFGKKSIYDTNIVNYLQTSQKKDLDQDLFRATNKILSGYSGVNEALLQYESEKVLLPLMIHQNYLDQVILNKGSGAIKYSILEEVSSNLSMGDVVENHIYGCQNWNMQKIHGFYTCVGPSYQINYKLKKSDKKRCNMKFAVDLNKTSIKKINKKNIDNAQRYFKNVNIHDIINIICIMKNLIKRDMIKECVDIMKSYNITDLTVDKILKIDKIGGKMTPLTSGQKKKFLFYFNK